MTEVWHEIIDVWQRALDSLKAANTLLTAGFPLTVPLPHSPPGYFEHRSLLRRSPAQ